MRLGSSNEPRDWDANWLVVAGVVGLPDGSTWSFEDPCLTTWEARELLDWLRQVRDGLVQPSTWDSDEERLLVFTEPNLAFSLAARTEGSVTIRAHLSLESGPAEESELFEYFVPLELTSKALVDAIVDWESALRAFPVR
ncbi:WapI family immunity protein [Nocardioides sp. GXZ039]|uniref:WapI family immunity protein n=1 Tax=Nocardioides sp. GXZ039 TaxID=3136018 RepID=UPI0030F3E7B3